MQMINRYFAPFALFLIISAVYCSHPDPFDLKLSLGILVAAALVGWWLSANYYRLMRFGKATRSLLVWLDFLWAVPLFYLLYPYWAPMWLLFTMPPVTAALSLGRGQTLLVAAACSGTMLAIFYSHGAFQALVSGGMAVVQAAFIIALALFVHGLAQTALRLRDMNV